MKKFILFIFVFLLYFLPNFLLDFDPQFYSSINLPMFSLPPIAFSIIWFIIYILISISVVKVVQENPISSETLNYYYMLLINYILNQSFSYIFFEMQDLFLAFVVTVLVFITSLYLYSYTYDLNKKAAYLLIPYVLWTLLASMLALNIYIIN